MRQWLIILLFSCFLISCIEGGSSSSSVKAIPPVRIECHSAQHADCIPQKSGKSVYVGLTINPVACGAYLLSQPPTQTLQQVFDAVGVTSVSSEGGFLVGLIENWFNFGNVQVLDLPEGEYTACSFIDQNNDGRWSTGEPLSSGQLTTGATEVLLDIWN